LCETRKGINTYPSKKVVGDLNPSQVGLVGNTLKKSIEMTFIVARSSAICVGKDAGDPTEKFWAVDRGDYEK
jgi:hypothetical protein